MSIYVDLHKNNLSLDSLKEYLHREEELILTDIGLPIARVTVFDVQTEPSINSRLLQKQQDILKNIDVVWDEKNVQAVEQVQREINQWKIQTF